MEAADPTARALAKLSEEMGEHIAENKDAHKTITNTLLAHTEQEEDRWKLLFGNGDVGLFEQVRQVQKWQAARSKGEWILFATVAGLVAKALLEALR